MQRSITQQSTSNLNQSLITRKKKTVLIKAFRNSNHTEMISQQNKGVDENETEENSLIKRLKTQRYAYENEEEAQLRTKATSMRVNTEQAGLSPKKRKNIFDNDYVNCLNQGFTHAYQEFTKIVPKTKDINDFQGPVYFSQRNTEPSENPQFTSSPVIEEEVYRFHKNPKLLKFKVSLKRQSFNPTQNQKQPYRSSQQKKTARVLITQIRTEQSKLTLMNRSSLQSHQSSSMKLQPLIKKHKNPQSYSSQTKPRSLKIPQLSENSNLFKSIKIFERKQNLLGQIEHHRQIEAKYGQKMFENLMRDKYKQMEKKNEYIVKVNYGRNSEPKQEGFKSKFIREIEEGKYETKFRYHQRQMPLKLKGRTKTMPRHETILFED